MPRTPDLEKIVSSAATRAKVVISDTDLGRIRSCQSDSVLAKWIEQNLVPERFLSKEEVGLSQSNDGLEVGSEPGIVPLREEGLLSVIADLDAETEALNRQASVLEVQRALVDRRDGLTRKIYGRALAAQIEERNSNEIHRLEREISEAREEIEGLLRKTGESIDRAARKIPVTMTELLNGHDRTLEALADEGLVGDIPEVVVSTNMDTVERLTASLSRMVAEELQIRLDRTYLESFCERTNQPNEIIDPPVDEDAVGLEQDLQSLYAEIPEVAAMYVTQKYGNPLVHAVRQEEMQRRAVATLRSDQVTSLLAGITIELEQLVEKLRTFHSYRCATRNLRAGYEPSCLSNKCNAPKTRKEISKPFQEHGPAMELLLRHFGISSTASRGLHESVDEKVARMQDNARKVGQNAGFDARKALEERKLLVESLLNGTDQNGEESLSKLDALDARINRLREDLENNVTIIGAQTEPGLPVSRDGGVSVLLNEKVLWLLDDTTVTNSSGTLVSFSSNSAAIASNSSGATALQDISHPSTDTGGTQFASQNHADAQTSDWILLSPSEVAFNQNHTLGFRLAIWPGTNPLAVSPALAWLWAPVVRVSNVTSENSKTIQQDYTYQYTTLAMLEDTKSGLTVARSSDRLFAIDSHTELSGKLSPFGCFANLVGKTSECYNEHFLVCRQHFVYLLGVYGDGLQLARLPLHDIGKSESAYEFWQSEYCNFSLPGDSLKLLPSSRSYLQGSFSTGSVFYNPFFETFVLVYMNADADSTLYVRYLDLNIPLCAGNGTLWQKGGINGQGVGKEDAEAIIHYQWSGSRVLLITPVPADSKKYNYAGMAHAEYFNRQYYQDWMYSNGGIDSDMRSPWLGQDIITEADAGGDGKHLMVSWTTPGKNGYEIVMAKVEFDRALDSSAEGRGCTRGNVMLFVALVLLLL